VIKIPAKYFICPSGRQIEIKQCLAYRGCPEKERCATLPYLRAVSFDREYKGVSPSMAGNGPRLIMLKATKDYAIKPHSRTWAILGTSVHGKLSMHKYTQDVLAEETLSEGEKKGIPDVLEEDEFDEGYHILTDYKAFGSFKVAKILGIVKKTVTVLDEKTGEPYRFKSGAKKGQVKTRQEIDYRPDLADVRGERLQLNRYRIFFARNGFDKVNKLRLQILVRDGNTAIAFSRGIMKPLYMVPIQLMDDKEVLDYYRNLEREVSEAIASGYARKCNSWETWEGKRCSEAWCECYDDCQRMGE